MTLQASKSEEKCEIAAGDTAQSEIWKGNFGREYTDRNMRDTEALDALYRDNYGLSRSEINDSFLREVSKDASFLEVGCNSGSQLELLQKMGWTNLSGIELQPYALAIAQKRLQGISLRQGSALRLPYADHSFDVVFTSGVLIHIAPQDLPQVMHEIYRCSRRYVWGLEYYAPEIAEVSYRGHSQLLWKMDFAKRYLELFPDLQLVKERRLAYVANENVDAVFLLQKRG